MRKRVKWSETLVEIISDCGEGKKFVDDNNCLNVWKEF